MATHYAIYRLDEVASTQDAARARFGGDEPVVVVAGRQLQGRGRTGNVWVHAPRASAASLALRPDWPTEHLGLIPLLGGLAAQTVVAAAFGAELSLKWPNDLMLGDAKVGGVLVEASNGVVVAGCGINVWWPDRPPGVAAVSHDDPGQEAAYELAEAWAATLLDLVLAGPGAWDRAAYVEACSSIGRDLEWDPDGRGRGVDISDDGGLVVLTDRGRTTLRSGEVRTVRPATLWSSESIDRGAESE